MRLVGVFVLVVALASAVGAEDARRGAAPPRAVAQHDAPEPIAPSPLPPQPLPPSMEAPPTSHRTGELDCRGCHQGKHQGVLRMYLGMGGRGTPMIPSHMFQVRVECVACHIAPKESTASAGFIGQTFRPSEQACVNCHGSKFRGMLERWSGTLKKMREVVDPKLTDLKSLLAHADPNNPRHARAKHLADDADFNVQFVALGRGVHNVFYAADLLKLSNSWVDEAFASLGKTPPKADDMLVRGGYCAVLCHEQAGVKQPPLVRFGKLKIPHVRHVTEFGAVCTACHSAEVHKKVTATAATCASCHHSPTNERCETCHRVQSAFYRGQLKTALVKPEPNVMVNTVGCTGCHDWTQKHSRQAVGTKCVGCHDPQYLDLMRQWTSGLDKDLNRAASAVHRAEVAVNGRGGKNGPAGALLKEARDALAIVRRARGVHNPALADALVETAQKKAQEAVARAGR